MKRAFASAMKSFPKKKGRDFKQNYVYPDVYPVNFILKRSRQIIKMDEQCL